METQNLIAKAEVAIHADAAKVWQALTDPAIIQQYMFGTKVESDWKQGSAIVWKGEWKGKAYEDKGVITGITPPQQLQYTHFSPLSGKEDKPENYHTVTITLEKYGGGTRVTLQQDKNANEKSQQESQQNWQQMLQGLRDVVERG
ncbi:Uncharacterized conserved protein YndB, AHSA1/START domain [Chitinophaga jiangningensis]|uniref:Uncharacterized conserved protein YndB, AHSA1/START domain n=1 Tax=Chitinophaga jiangningensis TaxID=1419482 RepID=A0A1M7A0U4_9BACT|nr:SRPBCC domain-containing protein [Chitinophaga jiangningensis]SHL36382.1 Uncharacterized conserved protein YndB, AHSA1/START domain [Chitinophaga jiangningensis]